MWYRKPKIMVTETGGLNTYYLYTGQQRLLERMSPLKIRIKKEGRTRQAKSSPPPLFVNKIPSEEYSSVRSFVCSRADSGCFHTTAAELSGYRAHEA